MLKKTYFPEKNVQWKEVSPELYEIDNLKLNNAINFAISNEYSGRLQLSKCSY